MINLLPGRPPLAKIGSGRTRLLKLVRALHCLLHLVWFGCLVIGSRALAQLLSVAVVATAATDVLVLTVLSVVAAVLARDDPSPPSAELIVAICSTQRQILCLKHILLCLGRLEVGFPLVCSPPF